jgi:signal transduction histidine kinase/CheY-like chemotaxis protein
MLLSLVVAFALSLLLAPTVTKPVLAVAAVARRVIEERDFTLRAETKTDDEIGTLVTAFNAMLDEVDAHASALRSSNELLRNETQERRAAEAALIAADQRKNEFLATLAHELRNPLAPMVNAAALMRDPETSPRQSNRALEIMERQLRHLVRLVEDLLDVSRITSGKLTVRRQPIELSSIVADVQEAVQPLLDRRRIRLEISGERTATYVLADPMRLAQVLSNLLNNAIKYSPEGTTISLDVEAQGESVRIYVKDRGIGIAQPALPRIFDMFSQGETEIEGAQTGLGVGLALAKRLVELHGGTIDVESAGIGKGSTFWIDLPTFQGQPEIEEPRTSPAQTLESSHSILLVDDNVDFVTSLGSLLEMRGHTVQIANDGQSGLELAVKLQPEFAFLDIGLPDISGYSLARRLHESAETRNIILIALSGWGQQSDRRKSSEAGFALHLVKPVGVHEIEAAMGLFAQSIDA